MGIVPLTATHCVKMEEIAHVLRAAISIDLLIHLKYMIRVLYLLQLNTSAHAKRLILFSVLVVGVLDPPLSP